MTSRIEDCQRIAAGVRQRVLMHTVKHGEGYLTQACSSAELLATLYGNLMNLGPSVGPTIPTGFPGVPPHGRSGAAYNGGPNPDFDRFILSPAHYALVLYATLIETGRLDEHALEQFNADGSSVEMIGAEHSPGMEVTSGSLGQALSVAIGLAMGRKRRCQRGRIWVMMSDGEFQEGQTWEALQAASYYKLDNLRVYVDANGSQCDGLMPTVMSIEPLVEKLRLFGWHACEVDGHDVSALAESVSRAGREAPLIVVARTNPWTGIPSLRSRAPRFHYVRFRPGEADRALADLGMTSEVA